MKYPQAGVCVFFLLGGNFKNQPEYPLDNMKFRKLETEWFAKRRKKLKKNHHAHIYQHAKMASVKGGGNQMKKSTSDVHRHETGAYQDSLEYLLKHSSLEQSHGSVL